MKRARRREIEIFSLSFLDVVSCGFGAMIVLLVVIIATQKQAVEQVTSSVHEQVAASTTTREALAAEKHFGISTSAAARSWTRTSRSSARPTTGSSM